MDLPSAVLRQRKRRMNQTQTGLLFLLVCVTVCTMSCDLRTCDLCWILHCGPVVVSILQLVRWWWWCPYCNLHCDGGGGVHIATCTVMVVVVSILQLARWWWWCPYCNLHGGGGGVHIATCTVVVVVVSILQLARWWWWWWYPHV